MKNKNINELHIKNLFEIDPWLLIENKMHEEGNDFLIGESLTSLGNGLLGSRGNFEEGYGGKTHKGVYNGGVWFPDKTRVGWWKNGYPQYFGKAINSLNFLEFDIFINDEKLDLFIQKPSKFKRVLDMKNGILSREFSTKIANINIDVKTERFYSIVDPETVFISYSIIPSKNCKISIISKLDGDVYNLDSNHNEKFWDFINSSNDKASFLSIKTKENPFGVQRFLVGAAMINDINFKAEKTFITETFKAYEKFDFQANANNKYEINKKVAVLTSRTHSEKQLKANAIKKALSLKSFEDAKNKHAKEWNTRWETSDIEIEGDEKSQQGVRFSLFQLFSTYYGVDPELNIGPKGFTGEKYGGATYWDTEAYCLPVYLATSPESVSKNLLLYRYKQLEQAKHNARMQGLDGALYPMVTFDGIECHNEWEITFEEIHRNGAIAFAIFNYYNYTNDKKYLLSKGLEVLIEISKFWASRVHYNKDKKLYMLHGVTGPNEFENNVNNNWYTNKIATWTLKYTISLLEENKIKLDKFKLTSTTINKWKKIVDNMYFPYSKDLDIFIQHDTFLDKELIEVKDLKAKDRPIVHNWSWDKILRSCFIKQADVLQGIYLFEDEFTKEQIENNYNFYEKYTVHESSLSPCIHSILAAKIDNLEDAERFYLRASRLDLDNYNDDTKDGLHITSMAGSWMSLVQGFGGMRIINQVLHFNPKLPSLWKSLKFKLNFRENILQVIVNKNGTVINNLKGPKLEIILNDKKTII
ncbi:MAG: family 65 glycosyl hydrolase domain-containing protein [Metamycoplasmataceae bacterium]